MSNPALASACAAIKACAEAQMYVGADAEVEWDDAALTALVASLLPPSDATVVAVCACGHEDDEHCIDGCEWGEDQRDGNGCDCAGFVHTHDRITYIRRRTPGEEQGNG